MFSLLDELLSFGLAAAERCSSQGGQIGASFHIYREHNSSDEVRRRTVADKLPNSWNPTQMEVAPLPSRSVLIFECHMTV